MRVRAPVVVAATTVVLTSCSAATPAPAPAPGPPLSVAATRYVDAVNASDPAGLVAAFAPDGEVVDVSRHIRGRDAIRSWATAEVMGGHLRVDRVTDLGPDVQRLRVHWAPAGSAGWDADYTMSSRGDGIVTADLQYAAGP